MLTLRDPSVWASTLGYCSTRPWDPAGPLRRWEILRRPDYITSVLALLSVSWRSFSWRVVFFLLLLIFGLNWKCDWGWEASLLIFMPHQMFQHLLYTLDSLWSLKARRDHIGIWSRKKQTTTCVWHFSPQMLFILHIGTVFYFIGQITERWRSKISVNSSQCSEFVPKFICCCLLGHVVLSAHLQNN